MLAASLLARVAVNDFSMFLASVLFGTATSPPRWLREVVPEAARIATACHQAPRSGDLVQEPLNARVLRLLRAVLSTEPEPAANSVISAPTIGPFFATFATEDFCDIEATFFLSRDEEPDPREAKAVVLVDVTDTVGPESLARARDLLARTPTTAQWLISTDGARWQLLRKVDGGRTSHALYDIDLSKLPDMGRLHDDVTLMRAAELSYAWFSAFFSCLAA